MYGNKNVLIVRSGSFQYQIKTIYLKDTIGAGDSFIAGFISVYIRRGSLKSCIEYAVGILY